VLLIIYQALSQLFKVAWERKQKLNKDLEMQTGLCLKLKGLLVKALILFKVDWVLYKEQNKAPCNATGMYDPSQWLKIFTTLTRIKLYNKH
jgi:hypothetical protein